MAVPPLLPDPMPAVLPWLILTALRVAALGLVAWGPALASAASAEPTERDWQAMRQVITAQREALRTGDGERAFSFATPAIRRQFGTPARFLQMVRDQYVPLLTARRTEFLPGATIDGTLVQPLRLVLPDDQVLVALYALERDKAGRWRIAGCLLAPSTVVAS